MISTSKQKKIIVAVSGYFNPVHVGHLDMFNEAKKLGDRLIVIVNNDEQVKLKGSAPFMNEKDRMRIIKAFKPVDEVILSIDTKDTSQCKTLSNIKPDIFGNGGDRATTKDIPEADICRKLSIKMVFGLGKKIRSSSIIIAKSASKCSIPIPVSPEE